MSGDGGEVDESHDVFNDSDASQGSAKALKCPSCSYTSTNKHYFRQHIDLVHTNNRPFKCPFCDYAGKRSHALKEHLIVHSSERPYQCTRCNATFRKKGHLTNHLRMHSNSSTSAECSLCNMSPFLSRDELYEHLRSFHKDYIGVQVFCCNRCSFATTTLSSLHVHEMAHYDFRNVVLIKPKVPPAANIILKCSDCGFEAEQKADFERHVLKKHKATAKTPAVEDSQVKDSQTGATQVNASQGCNFLDGSLPSKNIDKCQQCGYVTDNYKELILHIVSHKDSSNSADGLTTSEEPVKMNNNQVYTCNICGYVCESQRTIKAHMWKHSGHKNLQYPTFQNGPLSVYDDTLLASKNFINKEKNSVKDRFAEQSHDFLINNGNCLLDHVTIGNVTKKADQNHNNVIKDNLSNAEEKIENLKPTEDIESNGTMSPNKETKISLMSEKSASNLAVYETLLRDLNVVEGVKNQADGIKNNGLAVPNVSYVWSDTEQSAAALLSLLRHGTYESSNGEEVKCETTTDGGVSHISRGDLMETDYPHVSYEKPKAGICKSLLAVIDSELSRADNCYKFRRKRRKMSDTKMNCEGEVLSSEVYPNVEPLARTSRKGATYRCKLCHYSASAGLMKQHLKMHKNKKALECSLCDFVADSSTILQDHIVQHCKSRQFQCKICSAIFEHSSLLRAHSRIHEDGPTFHCNDCEFVTTSLVLFQEHLALHTHKSCSFTCAACRSNFKDLELLQAHMLESCGEIRRGQNITKMETERISDNSSIDDIARMVKCDQCDFVALSVRSLKSHSKRHVNDKKYVQQPLEQYKCNLCGYACHHLPSLKSHMWRHAGETDFSYSFSDILNEGTTPLDKNGKPLITLRCCQCGYETLRKEELNLHMNTHWDIIKKTFDVCKETKN